jgi:hypothetical protein
LAIDSLDLIDRSLWSSLKARFVLPVEPTMPSDQIPSRQSAGVGVEGRVFSSTSPLRGIISHLSERFGGNVHDHQLVTITANRPYNNNPSYVAKNGADLTANSDFRSANEPNQWIWSDFNRMKVKPTHYSIRSYFNGGVSWCILRTFVIIVINNEDERSPPVQRITRFNGIHRSVSFKALLLCKESMGYHFSFWCLCYIGLITRYYAINFEFLRALARTCAIKAARLT